MSAPRVCASNDERLSVDELKPTRRNGSYDTLLDTEKPSAIVLPKRNTDRWSHSTYCVANGAYVFGPQQGLRIPVAGLDLSDYTIEMDFVLTGGFDFLGAKLIDFANLTFDAGLLYVPNTGSVVFVMPPPGPMSAATIAVGTPVRMALRRDGSTRVITLAIDGVPQWALEDPIGRAVAPTDGFITLFADDPITKYRETSAGQLMSVRILSGSGG